MSVASHHCRCAAMQRKSRTSTAFVERLTDAALCRLSVHRPHNPVASLWHACMHACITRDISTSCRGTMAPSTRLSSTHRSPSLPLLAATSKSIWASLLCSAPLRSGGLTRICCLAALALLQMCSHGRPLPRVYVMFGKAIQQIITCLQLLSGSCILHAHRPGVMAAAALSV